ncbi:helix-turn-helix domain-containing protein [Paenibacillus physcomitrellae]|uniref:HTH cro/C1-type domain-containing protein n=1 Tax=Paenibacillus physcomitrellae TaxID=1619311 RepID=A0ABQ1GRU3_9BACL|nr:helix-turn-helix transcriptional regulator [Paenibacillus physcomitrellae]GGA49196.1 hypothetical protein GCM10010917_38080 [Paenibacillus physcomitrellae]
MRSYSEILKKYIDDSGLSLSQIETLLREKGLSTNKAYISKLQNGKLPPAGDEINKALSEVLGGDEDELIWASYAEKSPVLKEIVDKLIESFKLWFLNNKEIVVELISPLVDVEESVLNSDLENYIDRFVSQLSFKDKVETIKLCATFISEQNLKEDAQLENGLLQIDPSRFLQEEDKVRYRDKFQSTEIHSIGGLTSDEYLFLSKQLQLYRSLGLKSI